MINRESEIMSISHVMENMPEEEDKRVDMEYRTAFEGSQDAMFLVNVHDDSRFTYYMINKGYEIDAGISADTVKGLSPRDIFGEYFGKQIEDHYVDCIMAGKPVTYEESLMVEGNMKVWHTLLSPIIKDGKLIQIVGSSRNITQLKQWENEIARERQLFKVTLKSIGDAVVTTDTENRVEMLNKAAEAITGLQQEAAEGKPLSEVMKIVNEDNNDILEYHSIKDSESRNGHSNIKILEAKDGSRRIISISEASIRDDGGSIFGNVIVFRDVTMEKQRDAEVRYLGYHDSLTGLYNRAYFEEALTRLDDGEHLPLGLIMGDSNGLKMINDAFGHEEGDKLLKSITGIFRSICGSEGIVARVGGDEFAIILPNTSTEKMNDMVSRIKQQCNFESSEPICASIALGAAIKSEGEQDIGDIYKLAEDRMYNNKLIESKSIRNSILASLKKTLEERTHETEAHGQRLKELSTRTGRFLGLYDNELDDLSLLAMLHDIGKIAIPDFILGKRGSLNQEEWRIMKGHCEIGYRIAVASPELAHIAGLILSHHERWDGNGYPQGLAGEDIPLLSRIIAVVDAYDAMTNDRSYHRAIPREEALEEIKRCSGTQFDPFIVEKVERVIVGME
ncbi:MAG TPA: HD domain-containing phosphohydrolase, partial [Negativicutes bacterium]|nr:HD domain-containing phosphohydrolase [Negativicutes bacterium]